MEQLDGASSTSPSVITPKVFFRIRRPNMQFLLRHLQTRLCRGHDVHEECDQALFTVIRCELPPTFGMITRRKGPDVYRSIVSSLYSTTRPKLSSLNPSQRPFSSRLKCTSGPFPPTSATYGLIHTELWFCFAARVRTEVVGGRARLR